MIIKQVKEYGTKTKRQRIEFNKNDGLVPGSEVVILTTDEYDALKNKLLTMKDTIVAKDKELEIYQNQEQNLKEIVEDVNAPIHELYQNEISKKDKQYKQLETEFKSLHGKTVQYNLELMDFNLWDKLRKKDKKHIKEFNKKLTVIAESQDSIVDVDALPGATGSSDTDNQK